MAIKTIIVVGMDLCIRKEGIAAGVITPGHLLTGPASDLVVHASQAENAQPRFAIENEVVGGDIDTDYADNDTVLYAHCPPGSIVWAISDGVGITAEDFVESTGDGTMQVLSAIASTDEDQLNRLVGRALDTAAADARFRLEIF